MSKSAMIRDYKEKNPGAKPKEIVDYLKGKGEAATTAFVSTVISNAKKKKQSGRGWRKKASTVTAEHPPKPAKTTTNVAGQSVSVEVLYAVKDLVDKYGLKEVETSLATLGELNIGN